jgi:GNAT superfamily N-acetyltransferase
VVDAHPSSAQVRAAATDADWRSVDVLVREYLESLPFAVDFQDTDRELDELPTEYGEPHGVALLARIDDVDVGVVGVRQLEGDDAELKRMYVRASARGAGAGRLLGERAVSEARRLGYRRLLLDTVSAMTEAISLYESLGFRPTAPYRHNPRPDAAYFELVLR